LGVWLIPSPAICAGPDERNLEIAFPEMPESDRTQLLRGCFASLGRLLGEFSQLPRATPESLRQIIEYDEVGLDPFARGREKQARGDFSHGPPGRLGVA
jgi:hypothetical protein